LIEVRIHAHGLDAHGTSRSNRLTLLRAQLTLLRMRVEQGIPVSLDAISRTEALARSLEAQEVME
jgi:hypothetical protein